MSRYSDAEGTQVSFPDEFNYPEQVPLQADAPRIGAIRHIANVLLDEIARILRLLIRFVVFVFSSWLIVMMIAYAWPFISPVILQPSGVLCTMPPFSTVAACQVISHHNTTTETLHSTTEPLTTTVELSQKEIEPVLTIEPLYGDLAKVQMEFSVFVQSASWSKNIVQELKSSQVALTDLTAMIKAGQFPSGNKLVAAIDDYTSAAKKATRRLSRMESEVANAVNGLLAMDNYAIKSLEAIERGEKQRSTIGSAKNTASVQTALASREVLVHTFNQLTGVMESNIRGLTEKSVGMLAFLDQVESKLMLINEVAARDHVNLGTQYQNLVTSLMSKLGANKMQLAYLKSHVQFLECLSERRSTAAQMVGTAIVTLEKLSGDLDVVRERVAQPLLDERNAVPIEVHLTALRMAVHRLQGARGGIEGNK